MLTLSALLLVYPFSIFRDTIARMAPRPSTRALLATTARTQWEHTLPALRANTPPRQVRVAPQSSLCHALSPISDFVCALRVCCAGASVCSLCPSGRYEPTAAKSSCRYACPAVSGELFAKPRHSKREIHQCSHFFDFIFCTVNSCCPFGLFLYASCALASSYELGVLLPGWRHDVLRVPFGQVLGIFLRFVPILPEWPLRAYSESIELPLRLPCGELAHAFKRECRPTAEPAILILVAMALSAKPSPPLSTLTF